MITAILLGGAAGVVAGMLGVGGGILFVPALTLGVGLSQLGAEATSLLAIVPVSIVGAWRQHRYGNVRVREGVVMGALSLVGVGIGVVTANVLPERALEVGFAGLLLLTAFQMARKGVAGLRVDRGRRAAEAEGDEVGSGPAGAPAAGHGMDAPGARRDG